MEIELQNLDEKNNEIKNEVINELDNSITNEVTSEKQTKFLETTLGKVVNTGIDIGLRAVLPDLIEDQVVDIKDIIIKEGFKEGINTAVKSAVDIGKTAMGIVTGTFDSISQAHTAVKKGGLIDSVSTTLDTALKVATKNKLLSKSTSNLIKQGKNVIVKTVSNKIEDEFVKQVDTTEKLGKYISNWNEYYQKQDLTGMEREYKKIKTNLKQLMPLENTIKEARQIENIHSLIKNKNGDFNLTEEELELVKKLI